jgi:thiol-disulfide isomerase/thioredoxin
MYRILFFSVALVGLALMLTPANAQFKPFALPEFTEQDPKSWINSGPVDKSDLKGSVTIVDVWTFGCWNCYRSFPWLNSLTHTFKDLKVIGIHTPEFDFEKDKSNVLKKVKEFKLTHPVMMDNDFRYWKKLNNQYWPSFYLVDKKGIVRHLFIGEVHGDTKKSKKIEQAIKGLLSE